MLRRTLALTSLLALVLAIPVERSTPPPTGPLSADPCAETNTTLNLSPAKLHLLGLLAPGDCDAFRIVAALFLPHAAIAQATASAPGQTVADNPTAAVVVDTGVGVDSARAAVVSKSVSHSHTILWVSLAVIVLLVAGAWVLAKRKTPEPRYGGDYTTSDSERADRGKERTRGGP